MTVQPHTFEPSEELEVSLSLLPEEQEHVERLRAEVERLRTEKAERELADAENEAACQEIARRIDAENRQELAREKALEKQRDALLADVDRLGAALRTAKGNLAVVGEASQRKGAQRDALADAGHALALLALQSDRYHNDPDYRDATDAMLAALRLAGRLS